MKQTFLYSKYEMWISLRWKSKLEPFLNEVWSVFRCSWCEVEFSLLEKCSGPLSARCVKRLLPSYKLWNGFLSTRRRNKIHSQLETRDQWAVKMTLLLALCLSVSVSVSLPLSLSLYYKKTFSRFEQQGAGYLHWSKSTWLAARRSRVLIRVRQAVRHVERFSYCLADWL